MDATDPTPQDDRKPRAAKAVAEQQQTDGPPPFDWQVLLLRYLPEPLCQDHMVKRFTAR